MHGDQVQAPAAPAASTAPRTFAHSTETGCVIDYNAWRLADGQTIIVCAQHFKSGLMGFEKVALDLCPPSVLMLVPADGRHTRALNHPMLLAMVELAKQDLRRHAEYAQEVLVAA